MLYCFLITVHYDLLFLYEVLAVMLEMVHYSILFSYKGLKNIIVIKVKQQSLKISIHRF